MAAGILLDGCLVTGVVPVELVLRVLVGVDELLFFGCFDFLIFDVDVVEGGGALG